MKRPTPLAITQHGEETSHPTLPGTSGSSWGKMGSART